MTVDIQLSRKEIFDLCTIIIPTYNRSRLLKRQLEYLLSINSLLRIFIVDSGDDVSKNNNLELTEKLSQDNVNIHYFEYPSVLNLFEKIEEVTSHVKTKYSLIVADDDFINIEALYEGIIFLESNHDYSAVQGRVITYNCVNNNVDFGHSYPLVSIEHHSDLKRCVDHLSNYNIATLYGIHRSEILKISFKLTNKYTDDYRFGEIMQSLIVIISGKFKSLNNLYSIREIDPKSSGQTLKKIDGYMDDGTYNSKYKQFETGLIEFMENYELGHKDIRGEIERAMVNYLLNHFSKVSISKISDNHEIPFLRLIKTKKLLSRIIKRRLFGYKRTKFNLRNFSNDEIGLLNKITQHIIDNP